MSKAKALVDDIKQYIKILENIETSKNSQVYDFLVNVQERKSKLTRPDFPNDALYLMYKKYHQKAIGEYDIMLQEGVKAGNKEFTENNFDKVRDYLSLQLDSLSMVTREF